MIDFSEHAREITTSVLERLRQYVEFESPSGDPERAAMLAAIIAGDLQSAGAGTELIDAPGRGCHVWSRLSGELGDVEPVLVLGHLDTVFPVGTVAARPFRLEEGRAHGPGIFDMKANVALLVEALLAFQAADARPRRPVEVLITCDEEIGSATSRELIEERARAAVAVLVVEPSLPGGGVKTARKGVAGYRVSVLGRAAHAGIEPEKGVNAVHELAHQILRVAALADPGRGTTVNVDVVAGGTAANVIAAEAWAEVDVRFTSMDEAARIEADLRSLTPVLPGAGLTVELHEGHRPPLERGPGVIRLYEHAREAAARLGFDLAEGGSGGGSDGCFTAALGVPTLDGLGVQGGGAHAVDEHILVADIPFRVALLARLLETL